MLGLGNYVSKKEPGMRIVSLLIMIVSMLLCGASWAQQEAEEQSYVVRNITSDAVGEHGVQAESVAIRNAQLFGLRELLSRLVPTEFRGTIPVPKDEILDQMITERSDLYARYGLRNYKLVTDLSYDKIAVHSYLDALNVPYSKREPQKLLLVPQLITADGRVLMFDDSNSWLTAVTKLAGDNSIDWVPTEFTENSAFLLSGQTIDARYAEEVAGDQGLSGGYIASVSNIGKTPEQVERIVLRALRFGDAVGPDELERQYELTNNNALTGLNDLYARAISELTNLITDEWLAVTAEFHTQTNSIGVVFLGLSRDEWSSFEIQLEAKPMIEGVEFLQVRQNIIDAAIHFRGSLTELQEHFDALGFRFEAYSLIAQPSVIGFLAMPSVMTVPAGVTLLDLGTIQLRHEKND